MVLNDFLEYVGRWAPPYWEVWGLHFQLLCLGLLLWFSLPGQLRKYFWSVLQWDIQRAQQKVDAMCVGYSEEEQSFDARLEMEGMKRSFFNVNERYRVNIMRLVERGRYLCMLWCFLSILIIATELYVPLGVLTLITLMPLVMVYYAFRVVRRNFLESVEYLLCRRRCIQVAVQKSREKQITDSLALIKERFCDSPQENRKDMNDRTADGAQRAEGAHFHATSR